jgi:hypothetical protein
VLIAPVLTGFERKPLNFERRRLVSPWTRCDELCWRVVDGQWCDGTVDVRIWETPNARQWEYRCSNQHTREVGMTHLPGWPLRA